MQVTYYYGQSHWARVHRAGCQDIERELRVEGSEFTYDVDASSKRAVIEDVASDFIFANDRQPWTDFENDVSFAPCCARRLPRTWKGDDGA